MSRIKDYLENVLNAQARHAAKAGHIKSPYYHPTTGSELADFLLGVSGNLTPTHTGLEGFAAAGQEVALPTVLRIDADVAIGMINHQLKSEGKDPLSDKEIQQIRDVVKDAYQGGVAGKEADQAVSDALNNNGFLGSERDQSSDDHDHQRSGQSDGQFAGAGTDADASENDGGVDGQDGVSGREGETQSPALHNRPDDSDATTGGLGEGVDVGAQTLSMAQDTIMHHDPDGNVLKMENLPATAETKDLAKLTLLSNGSLHPSIEDAYLGMGGFNKLPPNRQKLARAVMQPRADIDEIMLKPEGWWTVAERNRVINAIPTLSDGDPRKEKMIAAKTGWFDHFYGKAPVEHDDTGKMIQPTEKHEIMPKPLYAETAENEPLSLGRQIMAAQLANKANRFGNKASVNAFQKGINVLSRELKARKESEEVHRQMMSGDTTAKTDKSPLPSPLLAEDGLFGPKTKDALDGLLAKNGIAKGEEALALGRMRRFVESPRAERPGELGKASEDIFGPLFRDEKKKVAPAHRLENTGLQYALNRTEPEAMADKDWHPLKEDGVIGPKTEKAFRDVNGHVGPDAFMQSYGTALGFFEDLQD